MKAPWSDDIVERLNAVQAAGYIHPYTCGIGCGADLIATTDGWVCSTKDCGYTQDWAHTPPTLDEIKLLDPMQFPLNANGCNDK